MNTSARISDISFFFFCCCCFFVGGGGGGGGGKGDSMWGEGKFFSFLFFQILFDFYDSFFYLFVCFYLT